MPARWRCGCNDKEASSLQLIIDLDTGKWIRAREEGPESLRFNFLEALNEDEGLGEGSLDRKAAILAVLKSSLRYCLLRVALGNMVLACRLLAYCEKPIEATADNIKPRISHLQEFVSPSTFSCSAFHLLFRNIA